MGTGLSTPVDICQLDSSSHLVVQKRGLVALVRTGSQAGQSTVLDIQSRVVDSGEGGLLSCAVDPEFPTEPYVYFGYITNGGGSAGQKRVSRFTWDVTRRTFASSSEVILVGDCSQGSSMCMRQDRAFHATVSLQFGPDNALYVATGDQALGGSGSQDTNDQSTGKILRINKADGRGFADNPFCSGGSLGSPRCRVWAYGFRNPWTFDFVPNSNNLLVFHVGEGSMESVILTTSGTNAGWPCYEGRNQRWGGCPGFSASSIVYQYSHTGNSASISGGTYFGRQFPGAYEGAYLIADYVRDTLSSVARGTATSFGGMGRVARIKKGRVDGLVYVLSLSSGITQLSWDSSSRCPGIGAFTPPPIGAPAIKTTKKLVPTTKRIVPTTKAPAPVVITTAAVERVQTTPAPRPTTRRPVRTTKSASCIPPKSGPRLPVLRPSSLFKSVTDATTLSLLASTNALGPVEKNTGVGGRRRGDGRPLIIGGHRFGKGFGTRVNSNVWIPLNRQCHRFTAYVGIDGASSSSGSGSAEALIEGLGFPRWNSTDRHGVLRAGMPPVKVEMDVTGWDSMRLVGRVRGGERAGDLDWAQPTLYCGSEAPFLPTLRLTPRGARPEVSEIGEEVEFAGSARDHRGQRIGVRWNVILWHCQGALCHIHPELVREATSPTFKYTLVEHPGCIWFEVKLAATDSCGRTNYASHFVRVASRDAACAA